jgi:hypothetical protein
MPQLYESRGEKQELLTRWGEARAALVSNEKRSPHSEGKADARGARVR